MLTRYNSKEKISMDIVQTKLYGLNKLNKFSRGLNHR
jgi:hypothetical protein